MSRRLRRPLAVGLLLPVLTVAVAGCSSKGPSSQPAANQSAPSAPADTVAAPTGPAPTTTAAPATQPAPATTATVAGPPACQAAALHLRVGGQQGAAGTEYATLVFTNVSTTACSMQGWPGVTFLDASGAQVGPAAVRQGDQGSRVVLAPGASASAAVGHPNPQAFPAGQCSPKDVARVRVYPPGSFGALTAADSDQICSSTQKPPSVSSVVAGAGSG